MRNNFQAQLSFIELGAPQKISSIGFEKAMFVRIIIDGIDILSEDKYADMAIVAEELRKSAESDGEFLIFTSICGVADDVGMNMVKVEHGDGAISWDFDINDVTQNYCFDKIAYLKSISELMDSIEKKRKLYDLEPKYVTFPE
jgi:hypothetical protein